MALFREMLSESEIYAPKAEYAEQERYTLLRNPHIARNEEVLLKPKDVPIKVLTTLAEFYIANKQEQSEWVILPVTNIGAYLGSSSLGRQYLSKIPSELMERKQSSFGTSVYRMCI